MTAVHVGDGACSILEPGLYYPLCLPSHSRRVAVVDCGERGGSPTAPAAKLLHHLGTNWADVRDVVVSHYDTDHWEGFTKLATSTALLPLLPELNIYVPHFPSLVIEGVVKFFTTRSPNASVGTMLVNSMKPLVVGGNPRVIALAQGDKVELAGRWFDVLWPPADLTAKPKSAIANTLKAVDDVANELANSYKLPMLRETLKQLKDNEEALRPPRAGEDAGDESEEGPRCYRGADRASESREFEPGDEADSEQSAGEDEILSELLPEKGEIGDRVKRIFARVRALNNDLSLILLSHDNQTLLLGDAGEKVVDHVLSEPPIKSRLGHVHAMLAPHHGTQGVPKNLPESCHCIAQTGKDHDPMWGRKHQGKHGGNCVSLHAWGGPYQVVG